LTTPVLQCIGFASLQICMDINLHKFICSDMGLLSACFAEQLSAVGNAFFVNTSAAVHCNTGSQQCCISAVTPMEICSAYRCAVTQHQCTATLFLAKSNLHCSVLLCKTGSQQCCVSAVTPMEIGSLYRCAVTQHQSTAALFLKVS